MSERSVWKRAAGIWMHMIVGSLLAMGLIGASALAASAAPGSGSDAADARYQGILNAEICLALDADASGEITADEVDLELLEERGILTEDLLENVGDAQGIADSCNLIIERAEDEEPVDGGEGDGTGDDVTDLPETGHGAAVAGGTGSVALLLVGAVVLVGMGMLTLQVGGRAVERR